MNAFVKMADHSIQRVFRNYLWPQPRARHLAGARADRSRGTSPFGRRNVISTPDSVSMKSRQAICWASWRQRRGCTWNGIEEVRSSPPEEKRTMSDRAEGIGSKSWGMHPGTLA